MNFRQAMVLLFLVASAEAETTRIPFVESYNGPHPDEFQTLLEEVKPIIPAALAYVTGQWGLPNSLHYPMIVRIVDVPTDDPARPVAAYVRAVWKDAEL